jgi:hypothetical protein
MLNFSGIPARAADGLKLEDARRRQPLLAFLQIHTGEEWLTFDPRTAEQGVPEDLLLWRQGSASLLDVVGGANSEISFSMLRQTISAIQLAAMQSKETGLGFLSFYELPIKEQGMFRTLLLLPLGVLVVAFMRMLIGLRTSGTLMPVLIAVAGDGHAAACHQSVRGQSQPAPGRCRRGARRRHREKSERGSVQSPHSSAPGHRLIFGQYPYCRLG